MIDLREMTVTIGSDNGPIKDFQTWWVTPFGLCQQLGTAKEKLDAEGIPYSVLKPITVAMCTNGLFEPILS